MTSKLVFFHQIEMLLSQFENLCLNNFGRHMLVRYLERSDIDNIGLVSKTCYTKFYGNNEFWQRLLFIAHGLTQTCLNPRRRFYGYLSRVYGIGNNEFRQLNVNYPVKTLTPIGYGLKNIECGIFHTAYLSFTGDLFISGRNGSGELGLGFKSISEAATFVMKNVVKVKCGVYYTLILDTNRDLFFTGDITFMLATTRPGKVLSNVVDFDIMSDPMRFYAITDDEVYFSPVHSNWSQWNSNIEFFRNHGGLSLLKSLTYNNLDFKSKITQVTGLKQGMILTNSRDLYYIDFPKSKHVAQNVSFFGSLSETSAGSVNYIYWVDVKGKLNLIDTTEILSQKLQYFDKSKQTFELGSRIVKMKNANHDSIFILTSNRELFIVGHLNPFELSNWKTFVHNHVSDFSLRPIKLFGNVSDFSCCMRKLCVILYSDLQPHFNNISY